MPFQHTIYLSGKITEKSSSTFYREKVAKKLVLAGFKVLDPLRSKAPVGSGITYEPGEIVLRDLQDVKRSSVMLSVAMKSPGYTSFGTPCEVMYAWDRKIPVVFVTNDSELAAHYWVRALCAHVFVVTNFDKEIDDILNYIIRWYGPDAENDVLKGEYESEITKIKSDS